MLNLTGLRKRVFDLQVRSPAPASVTESAQRLTATYASREDVFFSYLLLLRREPESDATYEVQTNITTRNLHLTLLESEEFRAEFTAPTLAGTELEWPHLDTFSERALTTAMSRWTNADLNVKYTSAGPLHLPELLTRFIASPYVSDLLASSDAAHGIGRALIALKARRPALPLQGSDARLPQPAPSKAHLNLGGVAGGASGSQDGSFNGGEQKAGSSDVYHAYKLVLGRDPEPGAYDAMLGLTRKDLLLTLVESDEFYGSIASPISSGQLASGHRFIEPPSRALIEWARGLLGDASLAANSDQGAGASNKSILLALMKSDVVKEHCRLKITRWSPELFLSAAEALSLDLGSFQMIGGRMVELYTEPQLHLTTNRIHDLPAVVIDEAAPARINVLVPAFEFKSMSAGFFGVFQVARFISQCGFKVRLVMFDNFYWNEGEFREKLKGYPGMEDLFDELEVTYIGERTRPLIVSPMDNCVATVWYSAYFAQKIMRPLGGRPFLYLIQDYETRFYQGGAMASFADNTYEMNFNALFSTKPLQDYFVQRGVGRLSSGDVQFTYFNNACASFLPTELEFMNRSGPHRLAFYSRPVVHRNMFELGALALCEAYRIGIFDETWEFYGVGLGDIALQLGPNAVLRQMDRVNLKDYQKMIATFDIGLCLMASPHPSLLPFDLGGSGAIVVTNTFETKQQPYFDSIAKNVIAEAPSLDRIVKGLAAAVDFCKDKPRRYHHAKEMNYPLSWEQTFQAHHKQFIQSSFAGSEAPVLKSLYVPR